MPLSRVILSSPWSTQPDESSPNHAAPRIVYVEPVESTILPPSVWSHPDAVDAVDAAAGCAEAEPGSAAEAEAADAPAVASATGRSSPSSAEVRPLRVFMREG